MFRGGVLFGLMLALAAAPSCVQAQDGAPAPSGPLELRPEPTAKKPAPKKPAPPKPQAAKAAPKPVVVPAKLAQPLPVDHAIGSAAAIIKPVASAAEKTPEKLVVLEPPKPIGETRPPFDEYVITQFCTSLSSAASDGRLAWQAKRMEEMESRLRDRIAELDAKRAETADWLKRREEALKKADETVVAIYSKMKPDAAAAQFSAMDESGAAAILSKLNPRQAGIVLNEIDASRAARIAAEMAGVGVRREVARSVAP